MRAEAYAGHPSDGYTKPAINPTYTKQGPPLPEAVFAPWKPAGIASPWPANEYLCDGGDQQTQVRVKSDWNVHGLEQEDTIAHFDTLDGRTLVEPTNRVCIYAPRFAAVRKVDTAFENDQFDRVGGVIQPIGLGRHDESLLATTAVQPVQPEGQIGAKRLTVFHDQLPGLEVANESPTLAVQDRLKPYENFDRIRDGVVEESEAALLKTCIQAAIAWTADQAVQVTVQGRSAIAITGDRRAEATYRYDLPGHPRLQICKVASTAAARPGETVDFTIRFDNVGDEKIGNVTIVDNLTTRLEYVPDSQQSSVKAEFSTERNEGDSLVLRWEITDPLEPGQGGLVRFRCKVR